MAGVLVTFEGGEGVGKSTLIKAVAAQLAPDVLLTREPGGTPLAEGLRQLFLESSPTEEVDSISEIFIFAAARHQHAELVLKPALAAGRMVLCDRFVDSTRVYQGKVGALETDFVEAVIAQAAAGCCPDMTVILDCEPALAEARTRERGQRNHLDERDAEFHRQVRSGFLELAKTHERYLVVDGALPVAKLTDLVMRALKERKLIEPQ